MIDESQTYSDGTLRPVDGNTGQADIQPAKKNRRGRVKGSKNKPKTPPTQPATEPATDNPEQKQTLRDFAQSILNTEEYRESVRKRAKEGKLTPAESKWLIEAGQAPQEKKVEGWRAMFSVATEQELVLLADLMRRAQAAGLILKTPDQARKARKKRQSVITGAAETAAQDQKQGDQGQAAAQQLASTREPMPGDVVIPGKEG